MPELGIQPQIPGLRPGRLTDAPADFDGFAGSMAEMIEEELNQLLALDGLPPLPDDADDREVRERRRFFIAISRGIVRHLVARNDAFVIDLGLLGSVSPTIINQQP